MVHPNNQLHTENEVPITLHLQLCSACSTAFQMNYISEGSVLHINGVWPGFLELQHLPLFHKDKELT